LYVEARGAAGESGGAGDAVIAHTGCAHAARTYTARRYRHIVEGRGGACRQRVNIWRHVALCAAHCLDHQRRYSSHAWGRCRSTFPPHEVKSAAYTVAAIRGKTSKVCVVTRRRKGDVGCVSTGLGRRHAGARLPRGSGNIGADSAPGTGHDKPRGHASRLVPRALGNVAERRQEPGPVTGTPVSRRVGRVIKLSAADAGFVNGRAERIGAGRGGRGWRR